MAKQQLEKNALSRYFEAYKEQFFKILIMNAIFATAAIVCMFLSMGLATLLQMLFGDLWFLNFFVFLPFILLGPVTAAVIKLCRDYVRGVPGFFYDDFKAAFLSNFKQSLLTALLQYIAVMLLYVAYYYYSTAPAGWFSTLGLGVTFMCITFLIFMSYYIYMMIVTLKLKLRQIIKNAAIFMFLCLPRNLLLTLILAVWLFLAAVFVYAAIMTANAIIWGFLILFALLLFFGFIFYTVAFFTFPPIKKYILDPYYEKHPEETSEAVTGEIDMQAGFSEKKEETPEFVYHNGKMVHRSVFEQEQVFSDQRLLKPDDDEDQPSSGKHKK